MSAQQRDIDNGGAWFNREQWWNNLLEEKGGAPNRPIRIYHGPRGNIIDIGVAYLTNDFRFRWRQYEVNLTEVLTPQIPKQEFTVDYKPSNEWKIRVRPQARFSTTTIIRHVSLGIIFEYSRRHKKIARVNTYASWRPSLGLGAFEVGFSISLLQW
jgi:hypothetical protein